MKKMYYADFLSTIIVEKEVNVETNSYVYIPGRPGQMDQREAKSTQYGMYCDTKEEAKSAIIQRHQSEVFVCENRLRNANNKLNQARAL